MPASLRTGTALYASALMLDRLLGLLLLPLLTRALSAADYGAWAQTAVATGVLLPLVLLAAPTAIVRSFSGRVAATLRRRFFLRLGGIALLLWLVLAAAALLWRGPVAALVYGDVAQQAIVPALLALLAADAAVDFATAWLRAAGRMGWISALLALRSGLRFGLVWWLVAPGAVALGDWLGTYAAGQCALAAAALWASWRLLSRKAPGSAEAGTATAASTPPGLRATLRFSLPLVALALFTAFNASFDRFLLVQLLGLQAVAVYAATASLCGVVALFYTVLGYTLFPELARHWQAGRRDEVARLTTLALQAYVFLSLPVMLTLALAGPSLLPLLSTADYRSAPGVFAGLAWAVGAFGLYQILLYALLLDGRSTQVLALAVGAALLNAALNLALAPRWGTAGAAAAAALSNTAMVLWATQLAARTLPWAFPWRPLWAITWRGGVAALPLAWALSPWQAQPALPWPRVGAMALLSVLAYLWLDRARPASVARMLLAR